MKLTTNLLLPVFLLIFSCADAGAQVGDSLNVAFNKYLFSPGDTLSIAAACAANGKTPPPSTLQMVIEHESGRLTRLRWPILNGVVTGDIALPDSLPRGVYRVSFGLVRRFFRIYGKVQPPIRTNMLSTMLLTGKGEWMMEDVPVNEDGSFVIKGWLFEKDATLVFSRKKKVNSDLDISLNMLLDSAYQPTATAVREFYLGTPPVSLHVDSTGSSSKADLSKFSDEVNLLPGVIVTGKLRSKAEKFNETYATGMFQSMNERLFDFMGDPAAQSAISVMDYLQGRVAGLQITRNNDGTSTGRWRDAPVSFYIDEMRVDAEQFNALNTSDIAIVKVFPPPFYGNSGGNGGAIAVYTRRGEYDEQKGNRHVFKIKGYSPLQTSLSFRTPLSRNTLGN